MEVIMKQLCLAIAVLLLFPSAFLIAQEWSAAQKEIWKLEEESMATFEKGDIEKGLSYIHADYRGLNHGSPVPIDKAAFRKMFEYMVKNFKITYYTLQPTAIVVSGNTAVAHYILTMSSKSLDGKEAESQTAWTDVFVKQGDKWLIIADNGNELKK
jgi:ketosteroid isomerase-like protein